SRACSRRIAGCSRSTVIRPRITTRTPRARRVGAACFKNFRSPRILTSPEKCASCIRPFAAAAGGRPRRRCGAPSPTRVFPGHGLKGHELVADLTLTQRQMVEIARAFTVVDAPVRLVILDEPTSSLDAHTAQQLLAFIRTAARRGIASILISHMLGEIERV